MLTCKAEAGRARKSERLKTETKNTKITASKFGRADPFYDSMSEICWCTILRPANLIPYRRRKNFNSYPHISSLYRKTSYRRPAKENILVAGGPKVFQTPWSSLPQTTKIVSLDHSSMLQFAVGLSFTPRHKKNLLHNPSSHPLAYKGALYYYYYTSTVFII